MILDFLLRNARLVTPQADRVVDIGVAGETIGWLGEPGSAPAANRTLDLDGRCVLPGAIDSHVHFREPGGHAHKGTYASESRAAAAGGVTCVLTMPNTVPFTGNREILEQVRECARDSIVDYGFHFGVAIDNLAELASVRNVAAYKLYMNETTGIATPLHDEGLLARLFALGHPVSVHAEGDTLDFVLKMHARYGVGPLYVVHLALAREVDSLRAAKARRQWVYAEATPHHLFMDERDFQRLGPYADMRPTLKAPTDVEALWQGLADGTVDTVATDHAPHLRAEKDQTPAPPGVPGLQTMLPLLLDAVQAGRLSLHDIARLCAAAPASIFALANKGEVRVGADADLAIVEPDTPQTIGNEEQLTHPGWTPFAGKTLRGVVWMTMRRGEIIYEKGQVTSEGGGREVTTRDPGRGA